MFTVLTPFADPTHEISSLVQNDDSNQKVTIFWMHIQKTSSWLGDFLLHWGCPEVFAKGNQLDSPMVMLQQMVTASTVQEDSFSSQLNCRVNFNSETGFGFHRPFENNQMVGTVAVLFRNPVDRVESAFQFGIMLPQGFYERSIEGMKRIQDFIRSTPTPFATYAQLDGIAGCQTKMVLGKRCGENITLTPADLVEAKRRVENDMYFVGLSEEPEASASLFLAEHSDVTNPNFVGNGPWNVSSLLPYFEFTHLRRSSNPQPQLKSELEAIGWRDPFDEALYAFAADIFYSKCARYSINVTHPHSHRFRGKFHSHHSPIGLRDGDRIDFTSRRLDEFNGTSALLFSGFAVLLILRLVVTFHAPTVIFPQKSAALK